MLVSRISRARSCSRAWTARETDGDSARPAVPGPARGRVPGRAPRPPSAPARPARPPPRVSAARPSRRDVRLDCDGDTVLIVVESVGGVACHTGRRRCFFNRLEGKGAERRWVETDPVLEAPDRGDG